MNKKGRYIFGSILLVLLLLLSSLTPIIEKAVAVPAGAVAIASLKSKYAKEITGGYWLPKNAPAVLRVAVTTGDKVTYKKTWEESSATSTVKERISKTIQKEYTRRIPVSWTFSSFKESKEKLSTQYGRLKPINKASKYFNATVYRLKFCNVLFGTGITVSTNLYGYNIAILKSTIKLPAEPIAKAVLDFYNKISSFLRFLGISYTLPGIITVEADLHKYAKLYANTLGLKHRAIETLKEAIKKGALKGSVWTEADGTVYFAVSESGLPLDTKDTVVATVGYFPVYSWRGGSRTFSAGPKVIGLYDTIRVAETHSISGTIMYDTKTVKVYESACGLVYTNGKWQEVCGQKRLVNTFVEKTNPRILGLKAELVKVDVSVINQTFENLNTTIKPRKGVFGEKQGGWIPVDKLFAEQIDPFNDPQYWSLFDEAKAAAEAAAKEAEDLIKGHFYFLNTLLNAITSLTSSIFKPLINFKGAFKPLIIPSAKATPSPRLEVTIVVYKPSGKVVKLTASGAGTTVEVPLSVFDEAGTYFITITGYYTDESGSYRVGTYFKVVVSEFATTAGFAKSVPEIRMEEKKYTSSAQIVKTKEGSVQYRFSRITSAAYSVLTRSFEEVTGISRTYEPFLQKAEAEGAPEKMKKLLEENTVFTIYTTHEKGVEKTVKSPPKGVKASYVVISPYLAILRVPSSLSIEISKNAYYMIKGITTLAGLAFVGTKKVETKALDQISFEVSVPAIHTWTTLSSTLESEDIYMMWTSGNPALMARALEAVKRALESKITNPSMYIRKVTITKAEEKEITKILYAILVYKWAVVGYGKNWAQVIDEDMAKKEGCRYDSRIGELVCPSHIKQADIITGWTNVVWTTKYYRKSPLIATKQDALKAAVNEAKRNIFKSLYEWTQIYSKIKKTPVPQPKVSVVEDIQKVLVGWRSVEITRDEFIEGIANPKTRHLYYSEEEPVYGYVKRCDVDLFSEQVRYTVKKEVKYYYYYTKGYKVWESRKIKITTTVCEKDSTPRSRAPYFWEREEKGICGYDYSCSRYIGEYSYCPWWACKCVKKTQTKYKVWKWKSRKVCDKYEGKYSYCPWWACGCKEVYMCCEWDWWSWSYECRWKDYCDGWIEDVKYKVYTYRTVSSCEYAGIYSYLPYSHCKYQKITESKYKAYKYAYFWYFWKEKTTFITVKGKYLGVKQKCPRGKICEYGCYVKHGPTTSPPRYACKTEYAYSTWATVDKGLKTCPVPRTCEDTGCSYKGKWGFYKCESYQSCEYDRTEHNVKVASWKKPVWACDYKLKNCYSSYEVIKTVTHYYKKVPIYKSVVAGFKAKIYSPKTKTVFFEKEKIWGWKELEKITGYNLNALKNTVKSKYGKNVKYLTSFNKALRGYAYQAVISVENRETEVKYIVRFTYQLAQVHHVKDFIKGTKGLNSLLNFLKSLDPKKRTSSWDFGNIETVLYDTSIAQVLYYLDTGDKSVLGWSPSEFYNWWFNHFKKLISPQSLPDFGTISQHVAVLFFYKNVTVEEKAYYFGIPAWKLVPKVKVEEKTITVKAPIKAKFKAHVFKPVKTTERAQGVPPLPIRPQLLQESQKAKEGGAVFDQLNPPAPHEGRIYNAIFWSSFVNSGALTPYTLGLRILDTIKSYKKATSRTQRAGGLSRGSASVLVPEESSEKFSLSLIILSPEESEEKKINGTKYTVALRILAPNWPRDEPIGIRVVKVPQGMTLTFSENKIYVDSTGAAVVPGTLVVSDSVKPGPYNVTIEAFYPANDPASAFLKSNSTLNFILQRDFNATAFWNYDGEPTLIYVFEHLNDTRAEVKVEASYESGAPVDGTAYLLYRGVRIDSATVENGEALFAIAPSDYGVGKVHEFCAEVSDTIGTTKTTNTIYMKYFDMRISVDAVGASVEEIKNGTYPYVTITVSYVLGATSLQPPAPIPVTVKVYNEEGSLVEKIDYTYDPSKENKVELLKAVADPEPGKYTVEVVAYGEKATDSFVVSNMYGNIEAKAIPVDWFKKHKNSFYIDRLFILVPELRQAYLELYKYGTLVVSKGITGYLKSRVKKHEGYEIYNVTALYVPSVSPRLKEPGRLAAKLKVVYKCEDGSTETKYIDLGEIVIYNITSVEIELTPSAVYLSNKSPSVEVLVGVKAKIEPELTLEDIGGFDEIETAVEEWNKTVEEKFSVKLGDAGVPGLLHIKGKLKKHFEWHDKGVDVIRYGEGKLPVFTITVGTPQLETTQGDVPLSQIGNVVLPMEKIKVTVSIEGPFNETSEDVLKAVSNITDSFTVFLGRYVNGEMKPMTVFYTVGKTVSSGDNKVEATYSAVVKYDPAYVGSLADIYVKVGTLLIDVFKGVLQIGSVEIAFHESTPEPVRTIVKAYIRVLDAMGGVVTIPEAYIYRRGEFRVQTALPVYGTLAAVADTVVLKDSQPYLVATLVIPTEASPSGTTNTLALYYVLGEPAITLSKTPASKAYKYLIIPTVVRLHKIRNKKYEITVMVIDPTTKSPILSITKVVELKKLGKIFNEVALILKNDNRFREFLRTLEESKSVYIPVVNIRISTEG